MGQPDGDAVMEGNMLFSKWTIQQARLAQATAAVIPGTKSEMIQQDIDAALLKAGPKVNDPDWGAATVAYANSHSEPKPLTIEDLEAVRREFGKLHDMPSLSQQHMRQTLAHRLGFPGWPGIKIGTAVVDVLRNFAGAGPATGAPKIPSLLGIPTVVDPMLDPHTIETIGMGDQAAALGVFPGLKLKGT